MNSPELGTYIRKKRADAGFSSIRSLHSEIFKQLKSVKVKWISYPYFQQIESLGRIPQLEDYLIITNFLKVDEIEASLYFNIFTSKNRNLRHFYESVLEYHKNNTAKSSVANSNIISTRADIDNVYTLSDSQLRSISKLKPEAYDVALALCETLANTIMQIASISGHSASVVEDSLKLLMKHGMITENNGKYKSIKRTIQSIGNINNIDDHWSIISRDYRSSHYKFFIPKDDAPKYRYSAVFPLSSVNALGVQELFRKTGKELDALENDPSRENWPYHMLLMFAPRFNQNNK